MSDSVHITCAHCDAVNRVPSPRTAKTPRCGGCHRPLFERKSADLNQANWRRHITCSDIPVLVDFWAPPSNSRQNISPQSLPAADALEPDVRLANVNTTAERNLGSRFSIRVTPTLVLFQQGKEVARLPGPLGVSEIIHWTRNQLLWWTETAPLRSPAMAQMSAAR